MNKEYLTTKETAEILNKNINTIYKYVQEGKLQPLSDHRWRMRRENLFSIEDVNQLKEELAISGYTTTEAANLLNVVPNTVYSYIQQGLIDATQEKHRGKLINIISEEELNRFQEEKQASSVKSESDTKDYYLKKEGYYLFQPFVQFGSNKKARIMALDKDTKEVRLVDENSKMFSIASGIEQGYKPAKELSSKRYSHRKGYAAFEFPFSNDITDNVYHVIDTLLEYAGHQNIIIEKTTEDINVKIRPTFIENNAIQSYIGYLENYLQIGEILHEPNGIIIDSDVVSISTDVTKSTKKWIQSKAEEEKINQKELISNLIAEAIVERKRND